MDAEYTTVEGVRKSLRSLKDFIQMLDERCEARSRHELNILVVNGKWYLDQFGQVGYLILQDQNYRQISPDAPIFAELGDVATEETFRTLGKKYQLNYQIVLGGRGALPSEKTYCAHCGAHWHIDNLDDYCTQSKTIPAAELMGHVGYHIAEGLIKYLIKEKKEGRVGKDNTNTCAENFLTERTGRQWTIYSDNDKVSYYAFTKYYHNKCHDEVIRQENITAFKDAFERAEFKVHGIIRTKNQYGSKDYRGDWFILDTDYGLIRVGWRKRVIEVDYSMIDNQFRPYTKETSGLGFEHVYGYEKLTEALIAFRSHLEKKSNFIPVFPNLVPSTL